MLLLQASWPRWCNQIFRWLDIKWMKTQFIVFYSQIYFIVFYSQFILFYSHFPMWEGPLPSTIFPTWSLLTGYLLLSYDTNYLQTLESVPLDPSLQIAGVTCASDSRTISHADSRPLSHADILLGRLSESWIVLHPWPLYYKGSNLGITTWTRWPRDEACALWRVRCLSAPLCVPSWGLGVVFQSHFMGVLCRFHCLNMLINQSLVLFIPPWRLVWVLTVLTHNPNIGAPNLRPSLSLHPLVISLAHKGPLLL